MIKPENKPTNEEDVDEDFVPDIRDFKYGRIPKGYILDESQQDFWPNVALGIALAEGFLPLTLSVLAQASQIPTAKIFELLFAFGFMITIGFTIGFLFFLVLAGFVSQLVAFVLQSLRADCENVFVAVLTGGLVGLVVILPFYALANNSATFYLPSLGAATILGQLGGTWGAWKTLRDRRIRRDNAQGITASFQFDLRQMLLATAWCAVILTVLKFAGLLAERFLGFFVGWLLIQLFALIAVGITNRFWQWQQP